MSRNEMYHHGIKGQKWGVRRFQNEDGSLTNAGRRRYNGLTGGQNPASNLSDQELREANQRMSAEVTYNRLRSQLSGPAQKSTLEKASATLNDAVQVQQKLKNSVSQMQKSTSRPRPRLDLSKMTDQELRDRINRENLERQYNDLFNKPANTSKGREKVNQILDVAGVVLGTAASAVTIAVQIQKLRGG